MKQALPIQSKKHGKDKSAFLETEKSDPREIWFPRNLVPQETWSIKKLSSLKLWSPRNFGPKKYGPRETQGTFDLMAIL